MKMDPKEQPAGIDLRKQSLYLPQEMVDEVKERGRSEDRSLSWLLQKAWRESRDRVASGVIASSPYTEKKVKQSAYFPSAILSEIDEEGHKHDRSHSWLIQQAWIYYTREVLGNRENKSFRDLLTMES